MYGEYDVIIVGGGVAGLTAAIFAARRGLETCLLESRLPGGHLANVERMDDYPGFPKGIAGPDFTSLLHEQAFEAGFHMAFAEATALRLVGQRRIVATNDGEFLVKAVIVSGGSAHRTLGIPGEEELLGRGVSHCATCDAAFFRDQPVAVVGGGDSAVDEALVLTKYASRVTLLHRGPRLSAQKALQDKLLASRKVEVRTNSTVTAIRGDGQIAQVELLDTMSGHRSDLAFAGVFIYVGLEPRTRWLQGVVPLDNSGHVIVDLQMRTPVPGVFAAGDIRQHSAAQAISCAGDGATAAISADRHVTSHRRTAMAMPHTAEEEGGGV